MIRVASTSAGRELLAGIAAERAGHFATVLHALTDEELAGILRASR